METSTRTQLQTYDLRTISRRDINPAPYNPRIIRDENRARLKKGIKRFGLVETLIWNQVTGHLVSGHQRLGILDELKGSLDYEVTVSVVHLTIAEEQALNAFLNNRSAQGEYDRDKFLSLLSGADAPSLSDMGFTELSLELALGPVPDLDERLGRPPKPSSPKPAQRQSTPRTEMPEDRPFFLLIFNSAEEKRRFMEHNRFDPGVMHLTKTEFETLLESPR